MRIFALAALAVSSAMAVSVMVLAPGNVQAQATCGPVAYSVADQKHVGVPCTPATPQTEAGKAAPCGPVAYSVADQKYIGVPCTPATPQAEAGAPAPCGPVAYSVADQKYIGVPCTH